MTEHGSKDDDVGKARRGLRSDVRRAIRLVRDVLAISAGRYGQYIIALVAIPISARALGPDGMGLLGIATAAYFFGSQAIDLGLTQVLSVRLAARESMHSLRTHYALLRAGLVVFLLGVTLIAWASSIPVEAKMLVLGLLAGGTSSLGEDWIFLGQARFSVLMWTQLTGRAVYLALLVAGLAIWANAAVAMLAMIIGNVTAATATWLLAGRAEWVRPSWRGVISTARPGLPPLGARLLQNAYGVGAPIYYSLVLSTDAIGFYSAADRLVRAASSALDAVAVALVPRVARRHENRADFSQSARRAVLLGLSLGCLTAAVVIAAAPVVVPVLLGPDFRGSVHLIQILSLVVPAGAVTSVLSTSIMLLDRDGAGLIMASMCGLTVAASGFLLVLVSGFGVEGAAVSVVSAEWTVMLFLLFRHRIRDRRRSA